jgi:hypothetical protein
MRDLSDEAKHLLGATPEDFVSERKRLVGELRQAGRTEDAGALADLRKPTAVVLAVNRAARDRPQAARDAARVAEEVAKAQLSGNAEKYAQARTELERALALLAEVAVAQLSRTKPATEPMRRRVADLLRSATADGRAREALEQGVLQEEGSAAGFSAFAGMATPSGKRGATPTRTKDAERGEKQRRERRERLEAEVVRAEEALEDAERALAVAERERDRVARALSVATQRLESLQDS